MGALLHPGAELLPALAHCAGLGDEAAPEKQLRCGMAAPDVHPFSFLPSAGLGEGPQGSSLLKSFWDLIEVSFEREPATALSIVSSLKRDPEVVSTPICYLYLISASITTPAFNLRADGL